MKSEFHFGLMRIAMFGRRENVMGRRVVDIADGMLKM